MAILIKQGLVYDGTHKPASVFDIFITGDKILRLGNFSFKEAETVIDARGAIVVPGFIDIANSADHSFSIFSEASFENLIKEGITTIIGGSDGFSLAPLSFSSLIDLGKRKLVFEKINVSWQKMKEFLKVLENRGVGTNFGTLMGYSTIRNFLAGEKFRDLTEKEWNFLKKIITSSFKEGALGISLDLNQIENAFLSLAEIKRIMEIAAAFKKVFAFSPCFDKKRFKSQLEEIIKIAIQTKSEIEINHFEPLKEIAPFYGEVLKIIENESHQLSLNFDISPFTELIVPLDYFLPPLYREGGREKMIEIVNASHWEKELLKHFSQIEFLKEAVIAQVPPSLKFFSGRRLKEISENEELSLEEMLLKLMRITNLKAALFIKGLDELSLEQAMISPFSFISSAKNFDWGFKETKNPKTFLQFIDWAERRKDLLPLERAISKITAGPAQKYQIFKRGLIKENYYADIVILRGNEISEVIINGQLVLKDGKWQKILAGRVLKT